MPKKMKMVYAGFWVRFAAAVIDILFSVLLMGFGWLVNVYLVGTSGYSIGKKILHLRVVGKDGRCPIGIVDALVREVIGKFVSGIIFGLGYLMIAFDPKKQGLHDKIAETYVVYGD